MTGLALALVLGSAVLHAAWNYLAKRIEATSADAWLFAALSMVLYAPLALGLVLLRHPVIGSRQVLFMVGTALLHTAYFVLLFRGYRAGGLSLVYPLARGTGPLLATIGAIAFLGERPSALALTGASLIGVSVFVLTGGVRGLRERGSGGAIAFALLTGGTIALYTLWDKTGVSRVGIHPILLEWGGGVGRTILLTPFAVREWDHVRARVRSHPRQLFWIAAMSPLAYLMVLTALAFTPVSYVAPLREVSIVIGAALGAGLLAEGDAARRLGAAAMMVAGVVCLSLG
jgi:drug/metabolite transporter (DMT)-like permease